MNIFFSVGEPSGDQHAAHLMTELKKRRPDVTFSGFGGPEMKQLMERDGTSLLYPLTNLAVMGFLKVIPLLWQFYRLVKQAEKYFRENKPDAVVLVDFPGFNWWIARKAKAACIPVFYYLPPQLWGWASWRIRKMKKFVDHVLCALPFEPGWYAERGMKVDFVGHPFFDEVAESQLDEQFPARWEGKRIVGVLPGSRTHEIKDNFRLQLTVIEKLHRQHPDTVFPVACYKPAQLELCQKIYQESGLELPLHFFTGKTSEIIEYSACCLMVSGSVSLEMLARKKPAVVIYAVLRFYAWIAPKVTSVDSFTLPNLIAKRTVLPEFLISGDPAAKLEEAGSHLHSWLSDPAALQSKRDELQALCEQVGETGASSRTANMILHKLGLPVESSAEAA